MADTGKRELVNDEQYAELRRELTQLTASLARERQERLTTEWQLCHIFGAICERLVTLTNRCAEAGVDADDMPELAQWFANIAILSRVGAHNLAQNTGAGS